MVVEMTYIALKPLRVGGKRRNPGELVPEAADWPRVSAWVDQGRITTVPKKMVDKDELAAAEKAYADRIADKQAQEQSEPEPEAAEESKSTTEMSRDELKQLADEQGIEVDGRWSAEKMAQVIFGGEDSGEDDGEE